jgi:glycosyltransferase involved in cell wall biosynthesis
MHHNENTESSVNDGLTIYQQSPKSVSVVIPALNEQGYIGKTLKSVTDSVRKYGLTSAQIVVTDSGSTDLTAHIVEDFKAKNTDVDLRLVTASQRGVSIARNTGAEHADGELLVFLDSDTGVQPDFIQNVVAEMERRRLDAAGCGADLDSQKFVDRIIASMVTLHARIAQYTPYPMAVGAGMVATKDLHKTIGGFDPEIPFGEDLQYARGATHAGTFRLLVDPGTQITFSTRRFDKEDVCLF